MKVVEMTNYSVNNGRPCNTNVSGMVLGYDQFNRAGRIASCFLALFLSSALASKRAGAFPANQYRYDVLVNESDCVLICDFVSTSDLGEDSKEVSWLSNPPESTATYKPVTSKFRVRSVLKSSKEVLPIGSEIRLLHFAYGKNAFAGGNGPQLLEFSSSFEWEDVKKISRSNECSYLLFLKNAGRSSYLPTTGQSRASQSSRLILLPRSK